MHDVTADFRVVIPARHDSVRLPGKPLLPIGGLPMIQHVWQQARRSGAREVWIATDDVRIAEVAQAFGAAVMMTDPAHRCGTDRVAEVVRRLDWTDSVIVVNVQSDEPLIPPANIVQVAALFGAGHDVAITTLSVPITRVEELVDPNVVKVVCAADGRALYFSRAPIPFARDAGQALAGHHQRHLGIYGYRAGTLRQLAATARCVLERTEKLEQLRALWLGLRIQVAPASEVPGPGVDTVEDLERVRAIIAQMPAESHDDMPG